MPDRNQKRGEPTAGKLRVLIACPILAHYRYDLFRRLEDSSELVVEFASGDRYAGGTIPIIPFDELGTVHRLRNLTLGRAFWQSGLISRILRREHDVVVFTGDASYISTWVAAALARMLRTPVLFWTIGWHRPEAGARRVIRLAFYRLANELLLYGEVAHAIGSKLGYPRDRMSIIGNSSSDPIPESQGTASDSGGFYARLPPPERSVVAAVVRLNRVKRLDLLLRAVAAIPTSEHRPSVLLVGDGPERETLQQLAASLGVDLYTPGPAYTNEQLTAVYGRADVTVLPSAAGLTVLQSLKYGCPVITHDNMHMQMPEAEAIRPGFTGDLYVQDDVVALASTITKWLSLSPESRSIVAGDCRASVGGNTLWSAAGQAHRMQDRMQEARRNRKLPASPPNPEPRTPQPEDST